jgi:hypothetical protein
MLVRPAIIPPRIEDVILTVAESDAETRTTFTIGIATAAIIMAI